MKTRQPSKSELTADIPASHLAESRLPVLDGIRGVAVLMVLVFHFSQSVSGLPGTGGLAAIFRYAGPCQTGVDLFFVLSGFLITGILLNAKSTPHFLRNFYARRAVRILPLYYLLVVGYIIAGWFTANPEHGFGKCWWYLLYLQNIGMTFWPGTVGEPGHFWSLGVEEHFYLLWPMLVLLCSERHLPRVLLGLMVCGFACRVLLLSLGYDVFTFSLCRMDALSAGALLAVVVRRPDLAKVAHRSCRWLMLTLGPLLVVLYPLLSGQGLFVMQSIKYLLVAVAYTAMLGAVVGPGRWLWLERIFNAGFLRWCGKYSYAMYVFHPLLYGSIMVFLRSHVSLARSCPALYLLMEFVILVGAVCLVSWASWHLFEKHFLKLKSHFEYAIKPGRHPAN